MQNLHSCSPGEVGLAKVLIMSTDASKGTEKDVQATGLSHDSPRDSGIEAQGSFADFIVSDSPYIYYYSCRYFHSASSPMPIPLTGY